MSRAIEHRPWRTRRAGVSLAAVLAVVTVLVAGQRGWIGGGSAVGPTRPEALQGPTAGTQPGVSGGASIEAAFRERRSDEWVEAAGVVVKVLADDREGVPHQRILVRVDESGDITVLIAHNLNAAERVPVQNGDRLQFRGEYEWTEKGGTVHFTHEPEFQRRDPGGWIEFSGKRYD